MTSFQRAPGVRIEPLGAQWVAFSALSGETHILNDTSAAVLECLQPQQPRTDVEVCAALAADCTLQQSEVAAVLQPCWTQLVEAGLIQRLQPAAAQL